ncbi:MAG: hypothetical protein ABGY75_11080 [Gemmataceae bacterium]
MNQLPLPGLIGSQPICALAAIGLLRVCSLTPGLGQVKLAWRLEAVPIAVLHFDKAVSPDDLIRDTLLAWMAGRWKSPIFGEGEPGAKEPGKKEGKKKQSKPAPAADAPKSKKNREKAERWDNDIKVSRETFAGMLSRERDAASPTQRASADHLSGYATDAREVDSSTRGKVVATTSLCMIAGNQALLKLLRDLAFSLDSTGCWYRKLADGKRARIAPDQAFRQVLFEQWDYSASDARDEGFLPLGWDAESYYVAALRGQATPDFTPPRAAIWLAAESLPLFPCTAITRGRVQTRGFPKRVAFRWPLWRQPLSLRAVQVALGHPALYEKQISSEVIQSLGIDQVYGSGIIELTDYKSFRPPTLLAEARLGVAVTSTGLS